ncbi:hypothetical protein B0H14DRAFT_2653830 [Mycena olivaceomarginata]|nr:hypothetical protein B0H14DRAFT_2653830 [Mycena olivaceomarginata]
MSHKHKVKENSLVIAGTVASVLYCARGQPETAHKDKCVLEQGSGSCWCDSIRPFLGGRSGRRIWPGILTPSPTSWGDTSLESQPDEPADDGINVVIVQSTGRNTKSSFVQDRPLQNWLSYRDKYLLENLCREGRGSPKTVLGALVVHVWIPKTMSDSSMRGASSLALLDQVCFREGMYCLWCIVAAHVPAPHTFLGAATWVTTAKLVDAKVEWYKFRSRVEGGYRNWVSAYSLDIPLVLSGPYRQVAAHDFVLYDLTGVHEMSVDFCGCPRDAQPNSPPEERRTQLLRACWWPATITVPNTCAMFRVLRHFQIIIVWEKLSALRFPSGTRNVAPIMMGSISLQTVDDPSCTLFASGGSGCKFSLRKPLRVLGISGTLSSAMASATSVTDNGEDGYYAHIAKHVDEEEISNCSGFRAMFLANSKRVWGLRTTGDYVIKFWECMAMMPEAMHLKLPPVNNWWMVPNFHLPDHVTKCRRPFSFHWMQGSGMTNGEGIEQNWAFSNGAVASTRLIGLWVTSGDTRGCVLGFIIMTGCWRCRLAVTIKDGNQHRVTFNAFSKGLEEAYPEQIKEWRVWVERWESTQHTTPDDSPFAMGEEVTSLRQIQLEIAMEEFVCASEGVEIERKHTPSTFTIMGIHMKRASCRASPAQSFSEPEGGLHQTAHYPPQAYPQICELQTIYMPSVHAVLTNIQKQMYDGSGEELPEVTRLFMPSEIADRRVQERVCAMGLPTIEARLHEVEAAEALESVRVGLQTHTTTNRYKLHNYTGQGLMTKGQGILRQINVRIHIAKLALPVLLGGAGSASGTWRLGRSVCLKKSSGPISGGATIEGGLRAQQVVASGEGSHTLSWIWYQVGAGEGENDECLEQALRVEWCKALARSTWKKCVARSRMGKPRQCSGKIWVAAELPGASAEVTEGRCAYAAEQAATECTRCINLKRRWTGLLVRADTYLEGRALVNVAALVTVEVDITDELDAEEEARLEGEEEGGGRGTA